jgi:autotransporter-associated beta strand protein
MKSKPNPFLRYPLALAASSTFLSMCSAQAATYDWTGATDSNFTEAGNWTQNSWTQWHDYRIGGTPTNASITINGYFGIGSLTLQSGLATDIVINSSNVNPVIMHTGIAGSATIAIASDSKNLTINGEYNAGSAVTWDVGANRTLTMNGPLNNWNGTASLVKNGAGTAVLSGINGYTGATNVNNGLLQVGTQNGLASNSAITVASGAELSMTAASNNTLGINTGLTLNGGTLSAGAGSAVTNYGNFHLGNSGSISVGNNTGTSNITGNLSVDGRDIHNNIGGFSAITVGDNSTLAISGNVNGVSGVSWGGISKYGNGTLKLTGTGGYAQGMYLAAGTVEFEENALGLRHASSPNEGYAADFAVQRHPALGRRQHSGSIRQRRKWHLHCLADEDPRRRQCDLGHQRQQRDPRHRILPGWQPDRSLDQGRCRNTHTHRREQLHRRHHDQRRHAANRQWWQHRLPRFRCYRKQW